VNSALIVTDVLNPYDHGDYAASREQIVRRALDAYVRRLRVQVVTDGVAHIDRELHDAALRMMERNLRAELVSAADCPG